jgi:hypothetical protein
MSIQTRDELSRASATVPRGFAVLLALAGLAFIALGLLSATATSPVGDPLEIGVPPYP